MKISLLLLASLSLQQPLTPEILDVEVVQSFPHETDAFTQGFLFADGVLLESTGRKGASRLRKLSMRTGKPVQEIALPDDVFGEGIARIDNRVAMLTWRSGQGFIYDLESFEQVGAFSFAGEGWGLTYDGEKLIMSDGTSRLRFLSTETFEEIGGVDVTLSGQPLPRLNELEFIDGKVWANVFMQDFLVRIDPETGLVDQVADLRPLFPRERRKDQLEDVLNGIAYEENTGRLFVTGKNWPLMFEVKLNPRGE